jgi:hypothetical protein
LRVSASDVLVQVHIPKCAGTSVALWLRSASQIGDLSGFGAFYTDFVFDDDSLWQTGLSDPRLTAVSAHNIRRFPAEVHERRLHYFTILRHPLAQFFSMVRYLIQERAAFGVPPSVADRSREIAGWMLDRPAGTPFVENMQTNHLALYPWCDSTAGRCVPAQYGAWSEADQTAYKRERLEVAKGVLRSFIAVGCVERLTETLDVLRRRSAVYGLHLLPASDVPRANVTRIPYDDVSWVASEPIGVRVLESVETDWELYAYAVQLLEEAVSNEDEECDGYSATARTPG